MVFRLLAVLVNEKLPSYKRYKLQSFFYPFVQYYKADIDWSDNPAVLLV